MKDNDLKVRMLKAFADQGFEINKPLKEGQQIEGYGFGQCLHPIFDLMRLPSKENDQIKIDETFIESYIKSGVDPNCANWKW